MWSRLSTDWVKILLIFDIELLIPSVIVTNSIITFFSNFTTKFCLVVGVVMILKWISIFRQNISSNVYYKSLDLHFCTF